MVFSTRDARRQTMSAEVREWCATGAPEERRSLVLRLSSRADLRELTMRLKDLGADVVSVGPGVAVAELSCQAARQASELPGVARIDVPARFSHKRRRVTARSDR